MKNIMELIAQALIRIQHQSTRNSNNNNNNNNNKTIKASTLNRMLSTHLRHYLRS